MEKITGEKFLEWLSSLDSRPSFFPGFGYSYNRCYRIDDVPFLLYRLSILGTAKEKKLVLSIHSKDVEVAVTQALSNILELNKSDTKLHSKVVAILL